MTQFDYKRLQLHKLCLDEVVVRKTHPLLVYLNMLLTNDGSLPKK